MIPAIAAGTIGRRLLINAALGAIATAAPKLFGKEDEDAPSNAQVAKEVAASTLLATAATAILPTGTSMLTQMAASTVATSAGSFITGGSLAMQAAEGLGSIGSPVTRALLQDDEPTQPALPKLTSAALEALSPKQRKTFNGF